VKNPGGATVGRGLAPNPAGQLTGSSKLPNRLRRGMLLTNSPFRRSCLRLGFGAFGVSTLAPRFVPPRTKRWLRNCCYWLLR